MTSTKRRSLTLLALLIGGAPLIACGGSVSLGDDQSQSQAIDPAQVGVAKTACPSGYQHANICCTGGSAQEPAQCEAWNDDPFHACDPNWTVYPNQAECCSLADPSQCVTCDAKGNCGDAGPAPAPTCQNDKCPPGWNGISPYDPGGCCRYTASGDECYGGGYAQDGGPAPTDASVPDDAGIVDGGPVDADFDAEADADLDGGPAPDSGVTDASVKDGGSAPDAGVLDASVVDGGPAVDAGPPPPQCAELCPPDWSSPANDPGVCCKTNADGTEQCFAFPVTSDPGQSATDPSQPADQDAGVAPQP